MCVALTLRAACTYLVDSTSSEEAKVVRKRTAGSCRKATGTDGRNTGTFKVLQGHKKMIEAQTDNGHPQCRVRIREKNGKDRRRNGGGGKYMRGEGRKNDDY